MLFLRSVITTSVALVGAVSAMPMAANAVQERQLSALAGLLPELGPLLDTVLGELLRREDYSPGAPQKSSYSLYTLIHA